MREVDLRRQYSPLPEEATKKILWAWDNYKALVGGRLWGEIYIELLDNRTPAEEIERRLAKYNHDREIASKLIKGDKNNGR